ncbi:MAG: hypothetical protein IT433_12825 [Phycisphaerales bacterium]|nr:hypothetical protein [Phycisphaerales bacterium]
MTPLAPSAIRRGSAKPPGHGTRRTEEAAEPATSVARRNGGTRCQAAEDQQLRVRFIDPPPDSGVEGGVDDVVISVVLDCADCCDGDMDADGSVNQDDVAYLVGVVGGGENPSEVDPDFNHDGNVDQDDVAALIGYVAGAGCP